MKYTGITNDSRKVKPGFVYVAIKGEKLNGEDFIQSAIDAGASKVVVSSNYDWPVEVDVQKVNNPRAYYAKLAAQIYAGQPDNIVAITGTNGKTSVASMYRQIVASLGAKSASLGTLGVETNEIIDLQDYEILTSPEPSLLHQVVQKLYDGGVTHLAVEASSHGLVQHRVDGLNIKASAFTNLSPEHLDYHKNMDEYLKAKLRLFTELTSETVVLNADIPEYTAIREASLAKGLRVISYGMAGDEIRLIKRSDDILKISVDGKDHNMEFHPLGNFQNYNMMAAIGLAIATGFKIEDIEKISGEINSAAGRLELVGEYNGAKVFVDYAHTPDALESALQSVKDQCKGKLHVIFGAGGDRDSKKRPLMGAVASDVADYAYVTDDNPRTEDPASIREQICTACPNGFNIGDRAKAISFAMMKLEAGDILIIAGKGHEDYQILGEQKIHFSDKEEVQKVISHLEVS